MKTDRPAAIRRQLEETFSPTEMLVKDQSHLHAGHAGAKDGKGHFDLTIVSATFTGQNRVQRHQAIYQALNDLLQTDIHALRIKALTPSERSTDSTA